MSIGDCLRVIPGEGMMLLVSPGKAWFNHTWINNDAPLPVTVSQSEVLLNRIDAIVIDIDQNPEVRKNDVILIKGTPAKTPQSPTLINDSNHHQYPLAYIAVNAGVTSLRAADITSMVGMSTTPYVTGILETVDIDALVDQWKDQWDRWYELNTEDFTEEFDTWFDTIQNKLTSDVAGSLQAQIDEITNNLNELVTLTASGWTGTTAPFTQTVTVAGATEDQEALVVSALSENATLDQQKAYNKAYGIINSGTGKLGNGTATFKVYQKPTIDVTVGLIGVI